MELKDIIKQRREELGYSYGKLAILTGLDKGEISRIENGKRKRPGIKNVKKICEALNLDLTETYRKIGILGETDKDFLNDLLDILDKEELKKMLELYLKEITFEAVEQNKMDILTPKINGIKNVINNLK